MLKPTKLKKLKNPFGTMMMKVKLILGFVQCISIFPKTFRGVEWPESFVNFASFLNIFSVDFFGLLGNVCEFKTGFYSKFLFQMSIVPGILCLTLMGYIIFKLVAPKLCRSKYRETTDESVKVAIFEVLFLVVYTL